MALTIKALAPGLSLTLACMVSFDSPPPADGGAGAVDGGHVDASTDAAATDAASMDAAVTDAATVDARTPHIDGDTGTEDSGHDRSDAGHGDPEDSGVTCTQVGACCIGGQEYLPEQLNPSNVCEHCDPMASTQAFSPLDGPWCGEGCLCNDGRLTEARCGDGADNDEDVHVDCGDSDCAGQTCITASVRDVRPTKDVALSSFGSETDGQATISLSQGQAGRTVALFRFDNIPGDGSITVREAILQVYVETPQRSLRLEIGGEDLGTQGTGATADWLRFPITEAVQAWAANPSLERSLQLIGTSSLGVSTVLRASEAEGGKPFLRLTYDGRCKAGACPAP